MIQLSEIFKMDKRIIAVGCLAVIGVLSALFLTQQPETPPTVTPDPDQWGVTLTATDVTPTGMTLVCTQAGGDPTGELHSGSFFLLEQYNGNSWEAVSYLLPGDAELAWTMEAWSIPQNGTVEWVVQWDNFYGALDVGTYRIGKEIVDFRGTGDYDNAVCYAEFEVPEQEILDDPRPLTADELTYFNETYFNTTTGQNTNLANQFLHNPFASPADIDLFMLFYHGAGADYAMSEDGEYDAVAQAYGFDGWADIPTDVTAIPSASMDDFLAHYTGITLAESNQIGLDNFKYLEEYYCYYNLHGDTNYYGDVEFVSGTQMGDQIALSYYNSWQQADYILTLVDYGDNNYKIYSNLPST